METTIEKIVLKPYVEPELLLQAQIHPEQQVTVHCLLDKGSSGYYNIFPDTFLRDQDSEHVSVLIHSIGIDSFFRSFADQNTIHFTLLFSALRADTKTFDLVECSPTGYRSFLKMRIDRTPDDVYCVSLLCI